MGASWSKNVRMSTASITTDLPSGPPPIPAAFKPVSYSQTQAPPKPSLPDSRALANTNRVTALHSATSWRIFFDASKTSNKLVVVDFTATWCAPCRHMEPILNEYAAKYADVDFVKVDVDELINVASEFGIQVMPTLIFLKNGKEVDKVVGVKKEELLRKIQKHRI